MYLDWNIMVVNGHRMVDELVARRAIDIAKEESELQQDVVRGDAPSASIELCGLLWDTENLAIGGYEKDGRHYYTWHEAMEAARSVGKRLPTREEWEALCDLGSTWDDERKGPWFGGNHDSDHKGSLFLPAAGWIDIYSGELANTSSYGYYWSSSPYYGGNSYAGNLSFASGLVSPLSNSNRASGFSVRCVRDK
ncbi:SUMF1/EgtB/PvdO family nonheme iron enzyme [Alistipes ihumii]|uniref:SUMF1/EgtB/PvdO family nonheme iron enzyme n=1 Tax=Alistipes ihumii TaxID=1470347 RepID=UPI0026741CAD|nr:FISUMP domain-containing protein [Alistipes ihumii]